jgi:hypothetical protein
MEVDETVDELDELETVDEPSELIEVDEGAMIVELGTELANEESVEEPTAESELNEVKPICAVDKLDEMIESDELIIELELVYGPAVGNNDATEESSVDTPVDTSDE